MPVFDVNLKDTFPMPTLEQGSPLGGVLSNAIAKRLKMAESESAEAKAKYAMRNELANVLKTELENQWNPKIWQSEIGLRGAQAGKMGKETQWYDREAQSRINAQRSLSEYQGAEKDKINYLLNHPGFMGGDDTKTIQALIEMGLVDKNKLQQGPQQSNQQQNQNSVVGNGQQPSNAAMPFNTGNELVNSLLNRKFSQSAYQNKMLQGFNWVHLPVETKNQFIAQGYGMGIDPLKMIDYVNKGMTLQDIAKEEGLDPNNLPPPIYSPTQATKTRVQQVQQVGAELDYLSSASTPLISQYANTFAGLSPDRISDMLNGDTEAQKRFGRYIGALSIQTGLANGRVLLEGGRAGLEVMRMVKDSSLKGIDQNSPIKMSKVAYEEAQKTIDELLQKGAKIRTTTGMNPYSEIGRNKEKKEDVEEKSSSQNDTYSKWENGKLVRVKK